MSTVTTLARHSARGGLCSSPAAPRTLRITVLALEGVVAIAAFGGGAAMITDPAGAMGLSPAMLDRLPVDSWLLPGVALITFNGVLPVAVAGAELSGRSWPRRFGHALAGAVLLAWPVTETVLFGYPVDGEPLGLRPAAAATGLGLIGLGLLCRVACGSEAGGAQLTDLRRPRRGERRGRRRSSVRQRRREVLIGAACPAARERRAAARPAARQGR